MEEPGGKNNVMFFVAFFGLEPGIQFTFDRRKIFFPGAFPEIFVQDDIVDRWGKIAKKNCSDQRPRFSQVTFSGVKWPRFGLSKGHLEQAGR